MTIKNMSSHSCLVNSCCCGCSLRTGSLIIGWLSLILTVLRVIQLIELQSSGNGGAVEWGSIIAYLLSMLLSILLLVGIYKNKPQFVMAYVYVNTVLIVVFIILVILMFVGLATVLAAASKIENEQFENGEFGYDKHGQDEAAIAIGIGALVASVVISFLAIFLQIYFIVVIRSFAIKAKEGTGGLMMV